ncbi:hypothetical protein AC578_4142 [Pseudocercospora eumusae]|uniref:Uncharacterized protein n=1 Tax=Pseudocercospora eumusae TaxID=321146 RepID=A0A139HF41_9PEZI|nr:hypothetical protein AC578_4142 [Pseudocercospora eumusae]
MFCKLIRALEKKAKAEQAAIFACYNLVRLPDLCRSHSAALFALHHAHEVLRLMPEQWEDGILDKATLTIYSHLDVVTGLTTFDRESTKTSTHGLNIWPLTTINLPVPIAKYDNDDSS